MRLVLKISQDIRQLDVTLFNHNRCGRRGFFRLYAAAPDGEVRLADLDAGLRYWRTFADRFGAIRYELFVVELHAIGRFVLDAVPEGLEFRAMQNRLTRRDRAAFIGILDIQLPGQLAKDVIHLRQLRREGVWQLDRSVLQGLPQRVLHFALGIDIARVLQMRPDRL